MKDSFFAGPKHQPFPEPNLRGQERNHCRRLTVQDVLKPTFSSSILAGKCCITSYKYSHREMLTISWFLVTALTITSHFKAVCLDVDIMKNYKYNMKNNLDQLSLGNALLHTTKCLETIIQWLKQLKSEDKCQEYYLPWTPESQEEIPMTRKKGKQEKFASILLPIQKVKESLHGNPGIVTRR